MTDVLVAQKDGEITIQINGDAHLFPVAKGRVTVDLDDASGDILRAVLGLPGSRLAPVAVEAKAAT